MGAANMLPVKDNAEGRRAVPELEFEVALHGGCVRFWYQAELLPLPGDLLHDLDTAKARIAELERELSRAHRKNGKH